MMNTVQTKTEIRKEILVLRSALSEREIKTRSFAVIRNLWQTALLEGRGAVGLYRSIRNEVETRALFNELRARKVKCLFPRVEGRSLNFLEVVAWEDFQKGTFGAWEPQGDVEGRPEVIIAPGVAFGQDGYRIGFGQGYYDRSLKGLRNAGVLVVGIAYDFQLLQTVPHDEGDVPCDWIVTDKCIVEVKQ